MIRLLTVLLLCGCAGVKQSFDTTHQAKTQEAIMADTSLCPQLEQFRDLRKLQGAIVKTNLTIRHDVIKSKCIENPKLFTQALEDVKNLSLSAHGFWGENFSYWNYTRAAFDWFGLGVLERPFFDGVSSRFLALTAPDSTIPLPETSNSHVAAEYALNRVTFRGIPAVDTLLFHFQYPYLVMRWWKVLDTVTDTLSEYLLISLDTSTNDIKSPLRLNLHKHPDFGFVAWWKGGWLRRPKAYAGWDIKELLSEAQSIGVIPGPWSSAVWRVTEFRNTFAVTDSTITMHYTAHGVEAWRQVRFSRDSVVSIRDLP